ncbi:hypothetical protein D3C71_1342790 [compost metagenome]
MQRINADPHRRRGQIHRHVMAIAGAVAEGVADLGMNDICATVGQCGHIRAAQGVFPAAVVLNGCGVSFAVQREGDRAARRRVGGAADHQRSAVLCGVDNVIVGKGVDADGRHVTVQGHVMRGAARVSGFIADGGGNGVIPVAQAEEIAPGDKHRPFTVSVNHRLIAVAVEGHRHPLALFGGRCAAEGLPRQLLAVVHDIVARHGINGNDRCNGIHRQGMGGLPAVTGFIAYRRGDG